eukprot:1188965-Prorocentrum_minimum.AAC.1
MWTDGTVEQTSIRESLPFVCRVLELGLDTGMWRPRFFGRRVESAVGDIIDQTAYKGLNGPFSSGTFSAPVNIRGEDRNYPVAEWLKKGLMSASRP